MNLVPSLPVRDGGVAAGSTPQRPADAPIPGWKAPVDAAVTPFQIMVTRTVPVEAGAVGAASAPAKPLNPDDGVLERTRLAAGSCFQTLAADIPVRTAHVTMTVIPSGTVSRAEVTSPDTTNDGVLGCVRQQALSAVFSDNGNGPLRSYAIDVRVTSSGGSGSR
jgi:hypothetical protein